MSDKDWVNPDNWFYCPGNAESKSYKIQAMLALMHVSRPESTNEISGLFSDIDMAAYICSSYGNMSPKYTDIPVFKEHIQDINKARYILTNGCPEYVATYITENQPQLSTEPDTAYQALINNPSNKKLVNFFKVPLLDKSLVLKTIESGFYYVDLFLAIRPKDWELTRLSLEKRSYATDSSHYDPEVFKDRAFILRCLNANFGEMLYPHLPENLQTDSEICKIVLQQNPYAKVKKSPINSFQDFQELHIESNPYSLCYLTIVQNISNNPQIFQTTGQKVEVLQYISERGQPTYIEYNGGGPSFDNHPLQNLLVLWAKEDQFFGNFLESEHGKELMDYKVQTGPQCETFEEKFIPRLGEIVNTYYLADKLEGLSHKGGKAKKKKI